MQQPIQSPFDKSSTAAEVVEGIDLSGKNVLITGGAVGLGKETSRALAGAGANLTIAVRNLEKSEPVVQELCQQTGNTNIDLVELDLMSLDSVRQCEKKYAEHHDALHILINNAGIMAPPLMRNAEGIESQLQSNVIGHLLLSARLSPRLINGAPSRIVCLSSLAHHLSPVDFDDINFEQREYDPQIAYGHSKTANALTAVALHQRLRKKGVTCLSVHPGKILTDLARFVDEELVRNDVEANPESYKKIEAGAATSVWAATAPELEAYSGCYLEDCNIARSTSEANMVDGVLDYALDTNNAEKLWQAAEGIVGERLDI